MNSKNKEQLIIKYLSDTISVKEIIELKEWAIKEGNGKVIKEFIELNQTIETTMTDIDIDTAYHKVTKLIIDNKKGLNHLIKPWLKYAAIFIGLVSLIFFYPKDNLSKNKTYQVLKIKDQSVRLKLANGKTETLNISDNKKDILLANGEKVGEQNKNTITYKNNKNDKFELVYNELYVPYGKVFKVVLSDGTEVHLNAGSSLKYPVKFIPGKKRKVFLHGEGYFSVTKNANTPFVVNANKIDVTVLGTKFVVSSYIEDKSINTVLVEGIVKVSNLGLDVIIKPNQMASFNKTNKKINVKNVDTDIYTAWLHNKIIIRNLFFKEIIKKLERKYNVSIVNEYKTLGNQRFNAIFQEESIEQILNSFKKSRVFNYKIINNKIIITAP